MSSGLKIADLIKALSELPPDGLIGIWDTNSSGELNPVSSVYRVREGDDAVHIDEDKQTTTHGGRPVFSFRINEDTDYDSDWDNKPKADPVPQKVVVRVLYEELIEVTVNPYDKAAVAEAVAEAVKGLWAVFGAAGTAQNLPVICRLTAKKWRALVSASAEVAHM